MFYTYVEKQSNSIWGGWETRLIAFDTLRRYLYYTAPITQPLPHDTAATTTSGPYTAMARRPADTPTANATRRERDESDRGDETGSPRAAPTRPVTATIREGRTGNAQGTPRTPTTITSTSTGATRNNNGSGGAVAAAAAAAGAGSPRRTSSARAGEPPRRSNSVPLTTGRGGYEDDGDAAEAATLAVLQSVKWKRKMKLLAVVPVATIQRFVLDDVHLCERDFFQLEFTGENRSMATGECPPPGPLLCPSTGIPRAVWWAPEENATGNERRTTAAAIATRATNGGNSAGGGNNRMTSSSSSATASRTALPHAATTADALATSGRAAALADDAATAGRAATSVSGGNASATRRLSGAQRGSLSSSAARLPQSASTPAFGAMAAAAARAEAEARQRAREQEEKIEAAVEDVHQLTELYNALRMQFEELNYERRRAAHVAVANGRRPPPPPLTQTLSSPLRNYDSVFPPARKHITVRCRNEYELRRLWYVVQMVLGYDKLDRRPYWGLPPYDPRNGLLFGHIPMLLWHNFDALDKAVFYTFIRGDLLGMDEDGKLEACVRGAYLCITHDTVLFMRDTGTIPCWIRLKQVCGFEYNCDCDVPFVVFRSDPPSPDVLFVPRAPAYGHEAIAHYNPRFDVRRIHYVMQELCFSSMCIRRVIQIRAVADHSAQAYAQRVAATGQPLCVYPGAGRQSELRALLPKERLASVWQQVQRDLRARGEAATNAAIPLYESTAAQLRLRPEQLRSLERVLDEERDRLDDVVGIPLQRAQELRPEPAGSSGGGAAARSQQQPHHHHHHRHRQHTRSTTTTTPHALSSRRGSQDRSSDTASTAATNTTFVTSQAGSGGGEARQQMPQPHNTSVSGNSSHHHNNNSHRMSSHGGAAAVPATTLTRASSSVVSLPASVGVNSTGAEEAQARQRDARGNASDSRGGEAEPLYTQLLPRSQSHSVTDVPHLQPTGRPSRENSSQGRFSASTSEDHRAGSHSSRSSSSSSKSSSCGGGSVSGGSEGEGSPDYVVPGARYITEDELRAGTAPFDATTVPKEQHTVIDEPVHSP